jgi:uncharacterized membrane protein YphA (DoxX/SURF4 family)
MAETSTQAEPEMSKFRGNVEQTLRLLWIVYGLFPIVAGVDKFTNLLADWSEFLPKTIAELLPINPNLFMYFVGVIEIIAGIIVLWRTEYGAYLVAAWLTAIAVTQIVGGNYDIAVRDLWIAVGAVALAQLTASNIVS